ncbi:hypothetical protein NST99_24800 [Paenibacillus sp. FSL L8-0470]|uniref:hypothetical protein n=1 Tax=Paenibacillus sp. FSL L8-0470 TaxID=2954688 RepID=UPI0030FBB552
MIPFEVSEKAIDSYKDEWGLEEAQYVRIYAKYAGGGSDAWILQDELLQIDCNENGIFSNTISY